MIYVKKFNNHQEYETFSEGDSFLKPNVSFCDNEKEVHFTPKAPMYIDLGLSVKWATMNVGATSETGFGNLYSWGGTNGNSFSENGTVPSGTKQYYWPDYELSNGGTSDNYPKLTKYIPAGKNVNYYASGFNGDTLTVLESTDDIAYITSNGMYRMPTYNECMELLNNTSVEMLTVDGVYGCKCTSSANGNSIFLPAAGACNNGSVGSIGVNCWYWTSSLYSDDPRNGYALVSMAGGGVYYSKRNSGYAVRGVLIENVAG